MDNKDHKIDDAVAKIAVIILAGVMMACIFCQGCSPKIIKEVYTQVVYRDRIIHDTTTFEVPYIVEKNVTKDTVSHLENQYGKSDAVVSEGLLWHSLETIPQIIKVPYTVEVTDTLIVEKEKEPVYIEKELTWSQQTKIGAFWYLVAGLALCILMLVVKFKS